MSILGKKLVKSWDTFLGNIVIIKPLANKISQWLKVSEDDYYRIDKDKRDNDNYLVDIWGNRFIMKISVIGEPVKLKFVLHTEYGIKISTEFIGNT